MIRVLALTPTPPDADVVAHLAALRSIDGVSVIVRDISSEDRLAFVLRDAARLFRDRNAVDVVLTVGVTALATAGLVWRGATIHVPIGRLSRLEESLARPIARRSNFCLVTSSAAIARQAVENVATASQVRVIRPQLAAATLDRVAARRTLGVGNGAPLIFLPGFARAGSNHRLSLWASSILVFRDPATRVMCRAGGSRDAFVERFAMSTRQAGAMINARSLSDADLAVAADVAICAADGAPEFVPLAALREADTPIVALRSTWSREGLSEVPATLVDESKARLLAWAALEAMEATAGKVRAQTTANDFARAEWAFVLRAMGGHIA